MYIKQDMDFNDLTENCWSGAVDTLRTIEENDKEDELITHLEEKWLDEIPTITEVNDYLWFESEFIFECLGISEDEEEEEEEDSYSDEGSLSSHCEPWLCEFCPHKCTCGM